MWDFILDHVLETNHGHNESTLTRNDMRALQLIEDAIWSYRYPELGLIGLGLIGTPEKSHRRQRRVHSGYRLYGIGGISRWGHSLASACFS